MGKRGSQHKKVLGVDKEMSFLSSLEAEVSKVYPQVQFYKTTTYEDSLQMMLSLTFDLFISEIRKEPGSALIDLAISLKLPILALTNGAESHEIINCISGTHT